MAVTVRAYGPAIRNLVTGRIDLDTDTFRAMAVRSSYVPDYDTHDFRDDVTAAEVANGNGYTTGGVTLTNVTVSFDAASDEVRFDCDDIAWTLTASTTFRYIVLYKSRGGAASADELLLLVDLGGNQTYSTAVSFPLNAAGLLYFDNA